MRTHLSARRIILSMYDAIQYMADVHRIHPALGQEVIEIAILAQWTATHRNGIEWVHGIGPGYTSVTDVLEDALEEMAYSEDLPIPREHLHRAAHDVLGDLPGQHVWWGALNEHATLGLRIDWNRYDVLIRFT